LKHLLIVTALLETFVGSALLVKPSATVSFLLGVPLEAPVGWAVARIAGVALVSLGIACWWARNGERGRAASGVVSAMLFYNLGAAAILLEAGLRSRLHGAALWPAIVGHQVLGIWCLVSLWIERKERSRSRWPMPDIEKQTRQ
jgi:hypothetical protein